MTVRVARLKVSRAEAEAFHQANRRAKAQAEIVRRLIEAEELPASARSGVRAAQGAGGEELVEIAGEEVRRTPLALKDGARSSDPTLTPGQRRAVSEIADALERGGGRFLLHGVTGSGKTEVYIRAIRRALELGQHGHRAGAGDRIDAADGLMAARAVRRGRRRAALAAVRRGAL